MRQGLRLYVFKPLLPADTREVGLGLAMSAHD